MRWLTLLLLGYVLCMSSGCSVWRETNRVYDLARRTTQVEPHYYEYIRSDKVAQREARLLAKQSWAENPLNGTASPDYKNGFMEGFADYLYRGGSGEPPVVPPRGYWNLRFLNQFGKVSVNDWYTGFRAGAADCKARGLRDMWLVPTSLVAEASDSTANLSEGLEWSDDETWDEETYRQRVEERKQEKARLEAIRKAKEEAEEDPPLPDDVDADEDSSDESEDTESGDETSSGDDPDANTQTGSAVDALGGVTGDESNDLGDELDLFQEPSESEAEGTEQSNATESRDAFGILPGDDANSTESSSESLIDGLFDEPEPQTSANTVPAETTSNLPSSNPPSTNPPSSDPAPAQPPAAQPPTDDATAPFDLLDDGDSNSNDGFEFDLESRSNRAKSNGNQLAFRTSNKRRIAGTQRTGNRVRRDASVRQASGTMTARSRATVASNPVRKRSSTSQKSSAQKSASKAVQTKSTSRTKRKRPANSTSQSANSRVKRSQQAARPSSGNASLLFFEPREQQPPAQALDFSEPLPSLPLQVEETDVIYWDPVSGERHPQTQMRVRHENAAQLQARHLQTQQLQSNASSSPRQPTAGRRITPQKRVAKQRKEINPADLVFDDNESNTTSFDSRPLPPNSGTNEQRASKFAGWDPMEGVQAGGFADLDKSKYKSVLSNRVLEEATQWTPEMARATVLPERIVDNRTQMSPKQGKVKTVDRPNFAQGSIASQDQGLRQHLTVALREQALQYRTPSKSTSQVINRQRNMAPVVDAVREPASRTSQTSTSRTALARTAPRFYRAGDDDLPMVIDREALPQSATQGGGAVQLRLRD